ncbi:MAG: L-tyrosine/L-tryptophan isonitrile synthase family protein [Cryobacterium sp.]|nr:L-tyrosine/L-tryptophan isonitrile synthase family protein [Oligoflexia bacterium]
MLEFRQSSVHCTLAEVDTLSFSSNLVDRSVSRNEVIARNILVDLMQFRRVCGPQTDCALSPCESCLEPHLAKIISAVNQNQTVTFVLPAFPGKSPNLEKVLGILPDMAERQALLFLQGLCDRIQNLYAPGAHIILCSDGRVFSDVVGMRDEDVTAYQRELTRMIKELDLSSISTFDLDDLYEGLNFDEMRARLMTVYGEPLDVLKAAVSRGGKLSGFSVEDEESNRLYCGITRFLVEDSTFPGQKRSRTSIQKECRTRAYHVIQRSKAWGDQLEARFPDAVRLSIHPQTCGAKKLGIQLVTPDAWLTPWHGVAVKIGEKFVLLKRAKAEALGARLVTLDGRPSHYEMIGGLARLKLTGARDEN